MVTRVLRITIIWVLLFADWLQFVAKLFVIGKYLYSNLYIFISVFNYVCLNGCHPSEMQGCRHEARLVKLLTVYR